MDPQGSNRSSISSISGSVEGIILHNSMRNSETIRTSQSLTSVINTPEGTLFDYIYNYVYNSFAFGIEPSAILQDVNYDDFRNYLNKISPYSKEKRKELEKQNSNEFTIERCYAEIPKMFFSNDFRVEAMLEGNVLSQQEVISMYLDMADVSIFNNISEKWEGIMNAAYGLDEFKGEIAYMLDGVTRISKENGAIQKGLLENYLKAMRLKRRLENLQKVREKLKLIETVKEAQPILSDLINKGQYTSVTQLLLKTQQTLGSKLQGVSCLKQHSNSLEKIKNNLFSQLDQEFSVSAHQFIVLNTFIHSEKLVKTLKNITTLESAFKLFPKDTNYERMNELIQNKISTSSLQQSLQELHKGIAKDVKANLKNLNHLLGVHKTDENSKWLNISHPHFIIVLQSIFAIFNSIFQKFLTLGTLIVSQFTSEKGVYSELKKTISTVFSKTITSELDEIEQSLTQIFFKKIAKVITARFAILTSGGTSELRELYELCEKIGVICKYLSLGPSNSILPLVVNAQKQYLQNFHERKVGELRSVLDLETWVKIDIPEEMTKFIMERRGEASRISGIKLEVPEVIATGSLLVFYKSIYEYVKISEELQISLECGSRLIEILRFYHIRTYELIVEAKAVPQRLARVTSKHLALSVQGLSFIIEEFLYIEHRLTYKNKDFLTVHLQELNGTKADYQSHLRAIYEKLCQIIISRVTEHCEIAVTEAKWETMISPSQMDNDYYLQQITKDLLSMHSILLTVLNSSQILEVFSTILQSLSESLISLYSKITLNSYVPAQRVKNDTQQLLIKLREKFSTVLQEPLEDLDESLQKFISEKCESHLRV